VPLKPLHEQPDEQLMKLYQSGNEAAFTLLYERHSSKVYGFLSKRIKNREKVAEIYQEVFIKVHKSKSLYNESLPLLPWLFTITKTVMLDELRKDKNIQTVGAEILENMPAVGHESVNGAIAKVQLEQLPKLQRQAIEMRYIDDQTFEQIAHSLNVKPDNARQIISRGIKRLRELVSEGNSNEK
jgi:RNA polymerase sigma-70 factor (ECF subfamily)